MPHDPHLVERIRRITDSGLPALVEKSMFGGFAWMLDGNFAFGANMHLVIRVGKPAHEEALSQPHVRPMDFTGRPMKGWVYVDPPGIQTDELLLQWLQKGIAFAASLPSK